MIEPLNDVVVIKPDEAAKVSKGGILIPETAEKDRATKGVVMAIGPGKTTDDGKFVPTTLKKGDHVAFHGYPLGLEVEDGGVKYKLIPEKQVMALVK